MIPWPGRHVSRILTVYADGLLPPGEARRVSAHLAGCPRCRQALEEVRFSSGVMRQLTPMHAPADLWPRIAADLARSPLPAAAPWFPRVAAAAFVVLAVAAAWTWRPGEAGSWTVAHTLDGRTTTTAVAAGEWVQTTGQSRARILVGGIGTVDVEPDTRVRLGAIGPEEYRMSLAGGSIAARITAPPRLFFVDTPAGTVVDLGCAYTVDVDEAGNGVLQVTEGWAALEWKGRESIVPAGAHCRIREGWGPGTPYFADAPEALQLAVDRFDAGNQDALEAVLDQSRVRDTLTLWHVLSRVEPGIRARVYDRIGELVPPPVGLPRERVLALDAEALRDLREELAWKW